MPRWHPVSISGYHIREAGITAAQELAFTLANGFAYVEAAHRRGARRRRLRAAASASSSTATSTSSRRSASSAPPAASGPGGCASATARPTSAACSCRFHTQTAGVSLTATAARDQHRAGRARRRWPRRWRARRACTPTATTRRSRCPPRRPRASPCAPSRSSPTRPARPTSPTRSAARGYVEWMTDEMERQAEEVFAHLLRAGRRVDPRGRRTRASRTATSSAEIADSAYRFEREVNAGRRIIVGVNAFTDGNDGPGRRHAPRRSRRWRSTSCERLANVRAARDRAAVEDALDALSAPRRRPVART